MSWLPACIRSGGSILSLRKYFTSSKNHYWAEVNANGYPVGASSAANSTTSPILSTTAQMPTQNVVPSASCAR